MITLLEKDLEDIIFNKIEKKQFDLLSEKGLVLNDSLNYKRQFRTGSGILDILGIKSNYDIEKNKLSVYLEVIELKKDMLSLQTKAQAIKYLFNLKESIELEFLDNYSVGGATIEFFNKIILIGFSINSELYKECILDDNLKCYFYEISESVENLTWDLKFSDWECSSSGEDFEYTEIGGNNFECITSEFDKIVSSYKKIS